jgi:hypothetical protein
MYILVKKLAITHLKKIIEIFQDYFSIWNEKIITEIKKNSWIVTKD